MLENENSNEPQEPQLNIGAVMQSFIAELKSKWNPKTETKKGYGYHGSSKGDEIEYTLYFDEYRCEWTTKDRAFQGYVFNHINQFIQNCA